MTSSSSLNTLVLLIFAALLFASSGAAAQIEPRPRIPKGWTDLSPGAGRVPSGVDPQLVSYVRKRAFAAFAIDLRSETAGDKMWVEGPVPRRDITEGLLRGFAAEITRHGQARIVEQTLCRVGEQPAEKLVSQTMDQKYTTLTYVYHLRNSREDVIVSYQVRSERFSRLRPFFEQLERAGERASDPQRGR